MYIIVCKCLCVCVYVWCMSWVSRTEITCKYLTILCEALQTVTSFKDCPDAFGCCLCVFNCHVVAPDYLNLRRRFRWDRGPAFKMQTLSQVKSLQQGGPLTVWLRFRRKLRRLLIKSHRNRKGWKDEMMEIKAKRRLCSISKRKVLSHYNHRPLSELQHTTREI